jgi:hypothetical protein
MTQEGAHIPPQAAGFSLPNPFGSQSSTPTDPGSVGREKIKGYFNQPIPLWAQKFVLAGLFPFGFFQPFLANVPTLGNIYTIFYATLGNLFNTLGMNGANLLLSGSMGWAAAKFGSNQMCQGAYSLIATLNPGQWWLPYLKSFLYYANPWFTFDMMQSFNPEFPEQGFKLPFLDGFFLNTNISINQGIKAWNKAQRVAKQLGKPVDPAYPKPLTAKLTPSDIGFVPPVIDLSGQPVLNEEGKPLLSQGSDGYPAYTYGAMTAMLYGLMIPYLYIWYRQFIVLMPAAVQAKIEPAIDWATTVLGAGLALAGTLTVGTFMAAPAAFAELKNLMPSLQQGGGKQKKEQKAGAKFPGFNEAIQNAMDSTESVPLILEGGGGNDADESILFLGSLAITSLAGISLALIRSKKI